MAAVSIQAGQFWSLDGDLIAVVVGKSETDDSWFVNHVCPQGRQSEGVAVTVTNFRIQLNAHTAMKKANERVLVALRKLMRLA